MLLNKIIPAPTMLVMIIDKICNNQPDILFVWQLY
jgi:hypothetical protein